LQCTPVSAAWDIILRLSGDVKCIDIKAFYLATAIPNMLTELFVLVLPIPYILHRQTSTGQRAFHSFVFLLGCL
jgi:hypothetical protein